MPPSAWPLLEGRYRLSDFTVQEFSTALDQVAQVFTGPSLPGGHLSRAVSPGRAGDILHLVIHDLHFYALADQSGNLLQLDVSALFRVVQLSVRVPFDDAIGDFFVMPLLCQRVVFTFRLYSDLCQVSLFGPLFHVTSSQSAKKLSPSHPTGGNMSIESALKDELKRGMKARDQATLDVVRMIRSKVQEATTAKGFSGEVNDALYMEVIQRYVKQMKKALPDYVAQGERGAEMVEKLEWEVSYLEKFLPQKLGEAETMALVQAAIEATGATDMKQMGMLMGKVVGPNRDTVDAAIVKTCIQKALSGNKRSSPARDLFGRFRNPLLNRTHPFELHSGIPQRSMVCDVNEKLNLQRPLPRGAQFPVLKLTFSALGMSDVGDRCA